MPNSLSKVRLSRLLHVRRKYFVHMYCVLYHRPYISYIYCISHIYLHQFLLFVLSTHQPCLRGLRDCLRTSIISKRAPYSRPTVVSVGVHLAIQHHAMSSICRRLSDEKTPYDLNCLPWNDFYYCTTSVHIGYHKATVTDLILN